MVSLDAHIETGEWLDVLAAGEAPVSDRALAEALVRRAAGLAGHMRLGPLDRREKTSISDIVTAADHAAEADVVAALESLRPDDGILGEEGTARDGTSGRTWIIDPVDGTYNYAFGLPHWCSAIALRGPRGHLVGAVRQESTDETWVAEVGADGAGATWLNGERLPMIEDLSLERVSLATYLHPTRLRLADVAEPWTAAASVPATLRMLGSGSADLAAVAAGRLGAFLQHSTADWDWFPGAALVLGAGGSIDVVEHRGYRWHLAGSASSVPRLRELLTGA